MGTVLFNTCGIGRPDAGSYVRGARAAFNLSGSTRSDYWFAHSDAEADMVAIANDWEAVGDDLHGAMAAAG